MSVTYKPVSANAYLPEDFCYICHDSLEADKLVAHNDSTTDKKLIHPVHAKCIREWVKVSGNSSCPLCSHPIVKKSLFSWKERTVLFIKDKNTHNFAARLISAGILLAYGLFLFRVSIDPLLRNVSII